MSYDTIDPGATAPGWVGASKRAKELIRGILATDAERIFKELDQVDNPFSPDARSRAVSLRFSAGESFGAKNSSQLIALCQHMLSHGYRLLEVTTCKQLSVSGVSPQKLAETEAKLTAIETKIAELNLDQAAADQLRAILNPPAPAAPAATNQNPPIPF